MDIDAETRSRMEAQYAQIQAEIDGAKYGGKYIRDMSVSELKYALYREALAHKASLSETTRVLGEISRWRR